jgi:hypothetical protein
LLIETAAEQLSVIKEQDGLTDAELGAVLHRGADQAAKYRTGLAEMGMVAFLRAAEAWNGRFTGGILSLINAQMSRVAQPSRTGRGFASLLAKLQAAVNSALENDDEIDQAELTAMRALLDDVRCEIDARLAKPALQAVRS